MNWSRRSRHVFNRNLKLEIGAHFRWLRKRSLEGCGRGKYSFVALQNESGTVTVAALWAEGRVAPQLFLEPGDRANADT